MNDIARFRALVRARLGLHFDDARTGILEETLNARSVARGLSAAEYLELLSGTACPRRELHSLAERLTVTETYFFRNSEQLDAFATCALSERAAARGPAGRVRVLSIGCASGDEAYSLAISARELAPAVAGALSIRAADMNPAMLAKARAGTYASWALRNTSPERRARWFTPSGALAVLDESIRASVTFTEGNLAADDPDLWRPDQYDIVFCRNVLMYFGLDEARAAVRRIERALAPGGFLFLGHAETLRGLSNAFQLRQSHDTFYYQRLATAATIGAPFAPEHPGIDWSGPAALDTSWFEAIQRATERIDALARTGRQPAAPPLADPVPDLSTALALIEGQQFSDGERVCRLLIERGGPSAGAEYLLSLCCEGTGDLAGARAHDEAAIAIDPEFAMARLHLGLLEDRNGNRDGARRHLAHALSALRNENAARLRLFGGGFSREALVALCRAVLDAPHIVVRG
jgi:chemotaxis protein methyltransferase CheR